MRRTKAGFTTVEMLVVIAVIGILVVLSTVAFNSARQRNRDQQRVNHVRQLQTVLETYFNANGSYPAAITPGQPLVSPSGKTYLQAVPTNPSPRAEGACSDNNYTYVQAANGASYAIHYCIAKKYNDLMPGDKEAVPGTMDNLAYVCPPNCVGKNCGDDGCGGSCGTCDGGYDCTNGVCTACVPNCVGKECGDDGCGGSCGACGDGYSCSNGACELTCVPNCVGKDCGDDGCGGSCGTCSDGYNCTNGTCVAATGENCSSTLAITASGTQVKTGTTATATNDYSGTCGGGSAKDRVYTFTLSGPMTVDSQVTGYDTVMYLRSTTCVGGTQVTCSDDSNPPGSSGSRVNQTLQPGTYYLFVDGYSSNSGAYTVTSTFAVCTPNCTGKDCGNDGCNGSCGTCSAGYNCSSSSVCTAGDTCSEPISITASGTQVKTGTTATASSNYNGTCGGSSRNDIVYTFTLSSPMTVDAQLTSAAFDPLMYLRSTTCTSGTQVECDDDTTPPGGTGSRVYQVGLAAGTYYLFVDAYSGAGAYSLSVTFTP